MASSIRALLFDFDGLILDTETPEIQIWKRIYGGYGFEYPVELALKNVGFWGNSSFDPAGYLHELTKDSLDVAAIRKRHHDESAVLIEREPVRPGVEDCITAAQRLGLRVAVVSSSPSTWVIPHLTRLGLVGRFERIFTEEDVAPGRTKPNPDLYLKALKELRLSARESVALEDSLPGVAAARSAGIYVVAVRNPTTALVKQVDANLVIDSLADVVLDALLAGVRV